EDQVRANLILAIFAMVPSIHPHAGWAVMIGDWVTIAAFTPLIYTEPTLVMALLAIVMAISIGRLGWQHGLLDAVGVIAVFIITDLYVTGFSSIGQQLIPVAVPVAAVVIVAAGLAVMMFYQQKVFEDTHRELSSMAEERKKLVKDMEDRTNAITEMAHLLSSSLNYQRVLDAALSVGRLAMGEHQSTASFVSLVLLYRSSDQQLYTITGLGMARYDDGRVTSGSSGLIREALTLCEPVFGENIRKDPELGEFATMRGMKSAVVVPLRAGFDNFGVMIFASRKNNVFSEDYRGYLLAIGIQTTIALQNAALYQNLYEEKERIVEVEKEARKKLARDLHDGPTQTISAIAMRMSIIRMMLDRTPEDVPAELKKIEELALQTTSEIRLMLYTLRPLALESEGGLTSALEQLADKFEAVYEQHVEVMVSERAAKLLTESQSETIFSIAQEAVNNARKHAQARTIKVRVTTYEEMVMLEISDNGRGFDVDKQRAAARGRNSLGMQNLTDLANLLDGTLTIDSAPGQGTTVTVLSPLDPAGLNGRPKPKPRKRRRDRFQLAAMR
ncbi:MAG: ATP-binding protein, partial [Chloroflexota bacterium]